MGAPRWSMPMWTYVFSKVELLFDSMFRWIEHSDEGDWTIIFAFMVVFGIICMRGYKSRL